MKRLALILLALCAPLGAQTTLTVGTTPIATVTGIGVNMGAADFYDQGQTVRNLLYAEGGEMPSGYNRVPWPCYTGGTNDTTHIYSQVAGTIYPNGYYNGAHYTVYDGSTTPGTVLGSGTITTSTTNAGGIQFVLGTALSSACATNGYGVMVVDWTAMPTSLVTPQSIMSTNVSSSATFESTDLDPAASNTIQALSLPAGQAVQFYMDGSQNVTNTNSTLAAQAVDYLNLNGTYTFSFRAKGLATGCAATFSVTRGSETFIASTTINASSAQPLSCTPTANTGWSLFSYSFTASETGTQPLNTINVSFASSGTGTIDVTEMRLTEGSTYPGNTTVYRDSVVRWLVNHHVKEIRFMQASDWCSDVNDQIAATGNRRWCTGSFYNPDNNVGGFGTMYPVTGYADELQLCEVVGADCWLNVGNQTTAAEWTTLTNWLSTQGYFTAFAAAGHKILTEDGNEEWNSGATNSLVEGYGNVYGLFLGQNVHAAKTAAGYNGSVMQIGMSDFVGSGPGIYSWTYLTLTTAGCTLSTRTYCPDFADNATYMLNYLQTFTASGGNVSTTGAPFLDMFAEDTNFNINPAPAGSQSVYANANYLKTTFNVPMAIYESNLGLLYGGSATPTQTQMNQISGSVGEAESMVLSDLLNWRDGGVTGPINPFTLGQNSIGGPNATHAALWGLTRYTACGPGQLNTCNDVDRPFGILMGLVNNAIGSNTTMVACPQSGTPTYSYAGGQTDGSSYTIVANAAVPKVQGFCFTNGSGNYTIIAANLDLTSAQTMNIAGVTPGTITQTVYPATGETIIANNENTFNGTGSLAAQDVTPGTTTYSSSIPAASFAFWTFSTSGGSTTGSTLGAGAKLGAGATIQ